MGGDVISLLQMGNAAALPRPLVVGMRMMQLVALMAHTLVATHQLKMAPCFGCTLGLGALLPALELLLGEMALSRHDHNWAGLSNVALL